jgi:hypothetical protein
VKIGRTLLVVLSFMLWGIVWGLIGAFSGCTLGFMQAMRGVYPTPWTWMICGGAIVGVIVGAICAVLRFRAGDDLWR